MTDNELDAIRDLRDRIVRLDAYMREQLEDYVADRRLLDVRIDRLEQSALRHRRVFYVVFTALGAFAARLLHTLYFALHFP